MINNIDPNCLLAAQYMSEHIYKLIIYNISSFIYSILGVFMIINCDNVNSSLFNSFYIAFIGYTLIVQGIISWISDCYYTLYKYTLNNVFHKIDMFMALYHAIISLLLHFSLLVNKLDRITILTILTSFIFMGYLICFPLGVWCFRNNQLRTWYYCHIGWHYIPGFSFLLLVFIYSNQI